MLKIIVGSSVDERRAILIVVLVPSTTTTVLPQHIAAEAVLLPPSLHGSTIVSRLDSRMQKCALVTITAAAASAAAALPPLHRKHFTSSSRLSLTLSSHLVYTYISII